MESPIGMYKSIVGDDKLAYVQYRERRLRFKKALELMCIGYALYDASCGVAANGRVLILDCGANIGQSLDLFGRIYQNRSAEIHCFEPSPYCIEQLRNRASKLRVPSVCVQKAVWVDDSVLKFGNFQDRQGGLVGEGGRLGVVRGESGCDDLSVESIKLSDYISSQGEGFDKLIVKMDIEGAELEVLEDLFSTGVINFIDVMYIEFHAQFRGHDRWMDDLKHEFDLMMRMDDVHSLNWRLWF